MNNGMIGAIVGDIPGARFEWHNQKWILVGTHPSKGNAQAARCTGGDMVNGWDRFRPHYNLGNSGEGPWKELKFRR